ncbi:MAG: hypothetical protein Q8P31_13860 [Bacillota bacterium]|nr:hypothetical protein [Bacillota bacterium]
MGEGIDCALLRAELHSGRPGQVYLLTGNDGLRLRAAAVVLAQSLNCLAEDHGARPCGHCRPCREIGEGSFADLSFDGPRRKIGEVREELARLAQRAYIGRCRVTVFSEAETMTREAHNALLKTLEDPPAGAAIILLASGPDTLPATVVSRCRHIAVGGETWHTVARALKLEGVAPSRAAFAALWAGEDLAAARGLAGRQDCEQIRAQAVAFVAGAIGPSPEPPLELVERHQARLSPGEEAGLWLAALSVALWGVIAASEGGEDLLAEAFAEAELGVLASLDPLAAADLAERIHQAARAIAGHAQARLSLEAALLPAAGPFAGGASPHPRGE